ncbi:MAG TPA: ATP12 family protein [Stellaceae bacterium]|nr:ATP12 family protein [Stellaceae bacterium]
MKRFYKDAAVVEAGNGFSVSLDGKPVRTPAKQPLLVPSRALAEAVAEEWRAQGATVDPRNLPLTRLCSIAIDLVGPRREAVVAEIAKYAGTDLVCYRAEEPAELTARQHATWQPLIDWAALRFDAPLAVTAGVLPVAQAEETLRAFERAIAAYDTPRLAALHLATAACGSLVVALALVEGRIDAEAAFAASELDESFEIERWGEDSEQTRRRTALKADIALARRLVELLAPSPQ